MSPNIGYPFPDLGHYDSEGKHRVEFKVLDGLKKKQYQDLCKNYRLSYSYGNIADLRQRLLDFSNDRDSWAALVPGAVLAHLGPRAGSKTKKKSTLRWEAKDRPDSVTDVNVPKVQKGMNPLTWASQILAMLPEDLDESPIDGAPSKSSSCASDEAASLSQSLSVTSSGCKPLNDAWSGTLCLTPTNLDAPLEPAVPVRSLVSPHSNAKPLQPQLPFTLSAVQPAGSEPVPSVARFSSPQLGSCVQGPDRRTVYLKTGPLIFTEGDVPDPPAFNDQLRGPMDQVVTNILKWWDDTRPEWDPQCSLLKMRINGERVAIPGVLWKELYAFPWKVNQWEGLKGRYSELSCLVREYDHLMAQGRIDDFWAPMKTRDKAGNSKVMRYTKAIGALRAQRKQNLQRQAEELVRDASFTQYFSYSRGGKTVGMRDATAIVKRAKKLKILA